MTKVTEVQKSFISRKELEMKRYEGDRYDTMAINGYHRLSVNGNTLESTRQEIDESNARKIKNGYTAEAWIITHKEWYTYYDDNGNFVKSEQYEKAVEIYPPVPHITINKPAWQK